MDRGGSSECHQTCPGNQNRQDSQRRPAGVGHPRNRQYAPVPDGSYVPRARSARSIPKTSIPLFPPFPRLRLQETPSGFDDCTHTRTWSHGRSSGRSQRLRRSRLGTTYVNFNSRLPGVQGIPVTSFPRRARTAARRTPSQTSSVPKFEGMARCSVTGSSPSLAAAPT